MEEYSADNATYVGEESSFSQNYRPISLLSLIVKIIEKAILTRLVDECEERHIVPDEQYDFRTGHSIEQQAMRLTDSIIAKLSRRNSCSTVFV